MPRRVRGVLVLENEQTGDGRVIAPGAVTWVDPPLPLAWLRDGDQHIDLITDAPQVGTIDTITRVGDAIEWTGTLDDEQDDGAELARRMDAGTAPQGARIGVSIDPDDWEVEIVATDQDEEEGVIILASAGGRGPIPTFARRLTAAAGDPDPGEGGGDDGVVLFEDSADSILYRFTRLRIRGATACAVPAFDGAYMEFDGEAAEESAEAAPEPTGEEQVAAAAGRLAAVIADSAPVHPPAEWFAMAEPDDASDLLVEQPDGSLAVPLQITPDGQVFGHIARWGQCHTGYVDACVPPPRSATGYASFHTGQVECDDGTFAATGVLFAGTDHAPRHFGLAQARDHYANTGMGWADVRVVDGEFGPWACGALRPDLPETALRVVRASSLSGDWRNGEMCAVLSVNSPGFPIARETIAASGMVVPTVERPAAFFDGGELVSLVAAGVVERPCPDCAERARLEHELRTSDEVLAALREIRSRLVAIDARTAHLRSDARDALRARMRPSNSKQPASR